MFARTERLLLRPGWIEDAAALVDAIADESITSNLKTAPWPQDRATAERVLTDAVDSSLPPLLIQLRTGQSPTLIGGACLRDRNDGSARLDIWIAPRWWGQGYATEAGRALVDMARYATGLLTLSAVITDGNSAAIRLNGKLGFVPAWQITRNDGLPGAAKPSTMFTRRLDRDFLMERPAIAA